MNPSTDDYRENTPPFWASLLLCVLVTTFMGWFRLVVFPERVFPISSGIPLLLCLWNKDLRLLYGMALAFTSFSLIKISVIAPQLDDASYENILLGSQMINIWLVAGVIHGLLNAMNRIRIKGRKLLELNQALETTNSELATLNEELAAREEEITAQNEELQSQTEELEQQSEELRQQSEEMEEQSLELQETNQELARREKGMQTLLDSGRWLRNDMNEELVMNGICQATIQVMGEGVHAVAVVEDENGKFRIRGDSGFGLNGAMLPDFGFEDSFASLVVKRGQTGYIENIASREDIELLRPAAGRPFRSVLASPIWIEGKPVAALEIYSHDIRKWSEQEFRVAEWLAAQSALTLQAIRFQRELEIKRGDAEEASIQKTRFLAAVSHDVRTPANAICLLAELIERLATDPKMNHQVPEMARSLGNNARSLIELVSDVLDLSRFDAGRMDLQLNDFSLSSLIENEVKQATPVADSRGLSLCFESDEEVWLHSDRIKLARVLSNLVGNAVKFTETGGVEVRCVRNADGGADISVIDTGIGIPEDHLPNIFDEFFQLRNPERDREKGTGLGLAICRRLLDGLGCGVSVKSLVGIGTTFTVHVPEKLIVRRTGLPGISGTPNKATAVLQKAASLTGLRILLVEDHHVTRNAMAQLLTAYGAIITETRNGREALHQISHGSHQVMLLDLNLPDIDGSEILKSLRRSKPVELECILVVSGDVRPARIEEVKRLGAADLISKPLSIDRILEALEARGIVRPSDPIDPENPSDDPDPGRTD
jgi:signal transduction histidine kinase/ActR/RegA family two-component response regulator